MLEINTARCPLQDKMLKRRLSGSIILLTHEDMARKMSLKRWQSILGNIEITHFTFRKWTLPEKILSWLPIKKSPEKYLVDSLLASGNTGMAITEMAQMFHFKED